MLLPGVPLIVAVPSPLSVNDIPEGRVPDFVIVAGGSPVVVTVKLPAVPTLKVAVAGLVNAGADPTESVAGSEVALASEFVNTARYLLPLSSEAAVKLSVVAVAPGTSVKAAPSMERCHWTVGTGKPPEAAVKVAVSPASTVRFEGSAVTTGARLTLRDAVAVALSSEASTCPAPDEVDES